jgi:rfaE bifunctional protein kinase chain/domain
VFDLVHPGIIKHLEEAKGQGDVLIVTVIRDRDVRRGAGRPIFPEELRAQNVASLQQVDYVCIVEEVTPFECVRRIRPDVFAKGQAYKERDRKIHDKIYEEEKEFYFGKSTIYETQGFSFSSSNLINNFLDLYSAETKDFLTRFAGRYSFEDVTRRLESLRKMNVLLIGDGIIDEYHYCAAMGRSSKTPIVVNKYIGHEEFAGAVFIIANHIAGICERVHLVTLLGEKDSREDFIRSNLKPNVEPRFFYRNDGPTIVKKRYVNQYLNQKLFEINYLNENYINGNCESGIINYLKKVVPGYDLVLVSDFGHGFITERIIRTISKYATVFAVNTQTNAANTGYNMITKYKKPNFVCLDETEARLATQDKFSDIGDIAKKIASKVNSDFLIVTLGKKGSIGVDRNGEVNYTPIFSTKVVDTVGAGDAFFAFTAPCFAKGMPLDFVSFVGNSVGALAVQIVGNKKPVEKHELLEFIHTILNQR